MDQATIHVRYLCAILLGPVRYLASTNVNMVFDTSLAAGFELQMMDGMSFGVFPVRVPDPWRILR